MCPSRCSGSPSARCSGIAPRRRTATSRSSSAPARAESQPASGPTARLSVGDEVVIRTQADIDQQRFVARVFELTAAGALINAGESEGIAVGQGLSVYRVNAIVGRATAREVRRSYAVVACSAAGDAPPPELRLGDELRLTDPPAPPLVVGVIERLVEPTLFTARLMTESPPLASPLAVRAAGRTVGVAILLTAKDGRAGGFVVPCSLTRSLATGMQLVQETSPTESAQAPAAEPAHP